MNAKSVVFTLVGLSVVVLSVAAAQYHKKTPTRTIASLYSEFPFSINEPMGLKSAKIKEELSLNCGQSFDQAMTLSESSQVVMLKFKKCDSYMNKKAVAYSVKNTTNGYQGQIFKDKFNSGIKKNLSASSFSTDYIQLESGENIIELQISLNDGQKINKKIKINRLASF